MIVDLPFRPRDYQTEFLKAMHGGKNRACLVWHRRGGKDLTCFNWMVYAAMERVGIYYYFFPTYTQGRRAIWYGMDSESNPLIGHHLPNALIRHKHSTDMRAVLKNGSIIQVLGLDTYKKDDIVGTNLMGGVFSEFSIQDPDGWDYMRPILNESGGWAIFN